MVRGGDSKRTYVTLLADALHRVTTHLQDLGDLLISPPKPPASALELTAQKEPE